MLKKILYILLLFISITAVGQRTSSSPYSFFGIGQQYSVQTVEQSSMGGIGISYSDTYHINRINPAGNANLRFSTYTIGIFSKDLTIDDGVKAQKSTSANLSYVSMGFPIGDKAGVSFGLQPNSSVGYSLLNINADVTEATRFYGTGGTSKLYGSFGMFIAKNLSFGVEAEYVFGTTENNVLSQRQDVHLATKSNEVTTVRGGGLKIGVQYKKELKNKLTMNYGATLKFKSSYETNGDAYTYSLVVNQNLTESPRDTLLGANGEKGIKVNGEFVIPTQVGLGVGIGKVGKWYTGVEYQFQDALSITGSLLNVSSSYAYGKSNKISFGGYYLPKANSISSYWQRVTYRAGLRVENTGLLINNTSAPGNYTEIKDFGISFGLGLPLGRKLSNLNLGFEYGNKGTTSNNLIKEKYFNFRLSLSLNDNWFVKRRID